MAQHTVPLKKNPLKMVRRPGYIYPGRLWTPFFEASSCKTRGKIFKDLYNSDNVLQKKCQMSVGLFFRNSFKFDTLVLLSFITPLKHRRCISSTHHFPHQDQGIWLLQYCFFLYFMWIKMFISLTPLAFFMHNFDPYHNINPMSWL